MAEHNADECWSWNIKYLVLDVTSANHVNDGINLLVKGLIPDQPFFLKFACAPTQVRSIGNTKFYGYLSCGLPTFP